MNKAGVITKQSDNYKQLELRLQLFGQNKDVES